jgi:YYY domain-containing protein
METDWVADAARWYGVLLLLSWGFAPLVALLCPGLPGRGAAFVRPLALLAVVYPSWLVSSLGLAPYATAGLWATLALGAVAGWGFALRREVVTRSWLASLVTVELVALAAFVAYAGLRGFAPHILNTEKPMDVAFLASGARAAAMPPADPWFVGEPINYYYLGYLLHGAIARMAGVPVAVGFNLALATTCSMAVVAAFGVGSAAIFPWLRGRAAVAAGALAAFLVVVAGNLAAPLALLRDPAGTLGTGWWFGVGWGASRVVVDADPRDPTAVVETITEFPFFSLLLGDLHPHLMALPFFLAALGLARSLLGSGPGALGDRAGRGRFSPGDLARPAAVGAVVGALYALNSWDYPTALLVALGALWVGRRAAPTGRRRGCARRARGGVPARLGALLGRFRPSGRPGRGWGVVLGRRPPPRPDRGGGRPRHRGADLGRRVPDDVRRPVPRRGGVPGGPVGEGRAAGGAGTAVAGDRGWGRLRRRLRDRAAGAAAARLRHPPGDGGRRDPAGARDRARRRSRRRCSRLGWRSCW